MAENYLGDFAVGSVWHTPEFQVSAEAITSFARDYDPQPYHLDAEIAAQSVFGKLVAPGFQNAAIAWKLGVESGHFRSCALAGIGIDNLRWLAPLEPGDTVRCTITILENKPSESRPDRGFLKARYDMLNQDDKHVMSLELLKLLQRRQTNNEGEKVEV